MEILLSVLYSSRKKQNAEHGEHHTARKLGALLESVIPQAPNSISAYSRRCTEIIGSPGVNPPGDFKRHGPFTDFVGADVTSIWAAATSDTPSIAMHLLACMAGAEFVRSRKDDIYLGRAGVGTQKGVGAQGPKLLFHCRRGRYGQHGESGVLQNQIAAVGCRCSGLAAERRHGQESLSQGAEAHLEELQAVDISWGHASLECR